MTSWDETQTPAPPTSTPNEGLEARRRAIEDQQNQGTPPLPMALSASNPFFPTYVWVYALVVIALAPLVMLTAESYWLPVWESLTSSALQDADAIFSELNWGFYFKLAIFSAITVVGARHCLTTLRQSYILAWAPLFHRPDPLHVPFSPHPTRSLQALGRWALHRFWVIVAPPLLLTAFGFGLAWVGFFIMNTVMDLTTLAMPLLLTVFLFIGFMLGLLTFLSVLHGVWLLVTTAFGDAIAQTEPDLPPPTVFERSRRIAFCSPFVWVLYPLVVLFWGGVLAEVIGFLATYDMTDVMNGKLPWAMVLLAEALTLGGYVLLHWLSLFCYHHALTVYYRQLPSAFRERFSRPDALGV